MHLPLDQDPSAVVGDDTPHQIRMEDISPCLPPFQQQHQQQRHLPNHALGETKSWEQTLKKAIGSILSIRANAVHAFDTADAGVYDATGFIVDVERGIILSNRHVVSSGPIIAKGILYSHEEITIYPIYRDPVHDFGFFKFNPKSVRFTALDEIRLNPAGACVGGEIRVVGNDAGEKLSILSGTLARMDRAAPDYGHTSYNDFNTFYYQAASGTSGGSSGSPVLNIHGDAIALNAGGSKNAASSYYLPLDRIKRALKLLQAGQHVPRGTIQTVWEQFAFDQVRRLGLPEDTEASVRCKFPGNNGMLVVKQTIPKGPADRHLVSGDILLRVQGQHVITHTLLEELMDAHVDKTIDIDIQRGSDVVSVKLDVQDLHSITPSRYLSIGEGILHDLSYQMARNYSLPVGGVYVACAGYMFAPAGISKAVVLEIDHIGTPTLADFVKAIKAIPDGKLVSVRYFCLDKQYQDTNAIVCVDRRWFPCALHVRDDTLGFWHSHDVPTLSGGRAIYSPLTTVLPNLDEALGPADTISKSMVLVDFHIPFRVEGVTKSRMHGAGLIVDKEHGYVLTDRYTVPLLTGDVYLIFAASIEIPATIYFAHPTYNYVLLRYDPALIGDTPVLEAKLSPTPARRGQDVVVLTMYGSGETSARKTRVTSVSPLTVPQMAPPTFRGTNVESIITDDVIIGNGIRFRSAP